MTEIKVFHKSPGEIIEIVKEMRAFGLVQGKDFDWAYHKASWSEITFEAVTPSFVAFRFYDEKWATMFSLKWGNR